MDSNPAKTRATDTQTIVAKDTTVNNATAKDTTVKNATNPETCKTGTKNRLFQRLTNAPRAGVKIHDNTDDADKSMKKTPLSKSRNGVNDLKGLLD